MAVRARAVAACFWQVTAGGFIYIATVDVVPTLFEDTNWGQTFMEVFAMLTGVGLMVAIAAFEVGKALRQTFFIQYHCTHLPLTGVATEVTFRSDGRFAGQFSSQTAHTGREA
eukprot:g20606.t1